jgi:ATP phosphoribosyltransferase regulatory subunit
MRDLLPEEAAARRTLAKKVLDRFEVFGFSLVTPPVFEFADVLERGLGTLDPADVLRFVEPESGEVAALRPDMTPQIARMISTRLRDRPVPIRLAYEGTVMRRRSGRTRKHRQIPQVGVELAGAPALEGDLELLHLAGEGARAAGLEKFAIDLGDAGVVRSLLAVLPRDAQRPVSDALARKDEEDLARACEGLDPKVTLVLQALPRLHGGREALERGVSVTAGTPAAGAAARLLALFDAAVARGLGDHLSADLGEVRGLAYYTGTIFHVYAAGTGDAIGSGGRYDELLARFGWDLPAAGYALDLDRTAEALRAAAVDGSRRTRVVVVGGADDLRVRDLRDHGVVAAAVVGRDAAMAWARAWGFTHLLDANGWVDVRSGASIAPPAVVSGERGSR